MAVVGSAPPSAVDEDALSGLSCDAASSEAGFFASAVCAENFPAPKTEPELPDPNEEVVIGASVVVAGVLPNTEFVVDGVLSELPKILEDAGLSAALEPKPLNGLFVVADEEPKTGFAAVDMEELPTLKAEGADLPKVAKGEGVADDFSEEAPKVKKDGAVGAAVEGAVGGEKEEPPNTLVGAGDSFAGAKGLGALVELVPLKSNRFVFAVPVEDGVGAVAFPTLKPANATGGAGIAGIAGLLFAAGACALSDDVVFEATFEEELSKSC